MVLLPDIETARAAINCRHGEGGWCILAFWWVVVVFSSLAETAQRLWLYGRSPCWGTERKIGPTPAVNGRCAGRFRAV